MKYKLILFLSLLLIAVAGVLGITAFRFARHEAAARAAGIRELLTTECEQTAARCRTELTKIKSDLIQTLRNSQTSSEALLRLQRQEPLIKTVFVATRQGQLLKPSLDSLFARHYRALFLDRVSRGNGDQNSEQHERNTSVEAEVQKAFFVGKRGGKAPQNLLLQTDESVPQQKKGSPDRLGSRFEYLTANRNSGWIPWMSQNEFCPIVWTLNDPQTRIVGARLETIAILAKLVPLVNSGDNRFFHIELMDNRLGVLGGQGFYLPEGAKAGVNLDVAHDLMPNLRIRGYINRQFSSNGSSMILANLLLITALLAVMIAVGGGLWYLIHREIIIAGQKTTFVANVSHELKTPLTSIRMYSELLQSRKADLPGDKQERYLKVISAESERLTRLIANVLDFSKMEAGEKKYHPEKLVLNELVAEVVEQQRPTLKQHDISLEFIPLPEPVSAMIDRDALIQVLQNLIGNAVKYAASGRQLAIELQKAADDTCEILVKDRGPGIPAGEQKRIFNKFYRIDDRLTAQNRGSGLGLTISRTLMRDQQGDLYYQARTGGGGVFVVVVKMCSTGRGNNETD